MTNLHYRWIGTGTYLVGMVLTAMNIYPFNLWWHVVGAFFWTVAAIQVKDKPLLVIEGIAVITYGLGIVAYFY